MEPICMIVLLAGVGYLMFRSGKQLGSRLGFRAGRRRTGKARRQR